MPGHVPMRYNLETRQIEVNEAMDIPAQAGVQFMVEEVMHGFDHVGGNRTLSASSPLFDMNDGVVAVEAKAAYQSGGRLSEMLSYPLGDDFAFMSDGQKQAELFARLAMAYLGDPQMMKEVMPNAYKVYEQLFKLSIDPVTGSAWSSPYFWRDTDSSRSGKIRGQHGAAPVSEKSRGRDRGAGRGAGLDGARERIVRALAASRSGAVVTFENLETRIPARKKAGFSFSGDSEWIANWISKAKEQSWGLLTLRQITEVAGKQLPKLKQKYLPIFTQYETDQNTLKAKVEVMSEEENSRASQLADLSLVACIRVWKQGPEFAMFVISKQQRGR